MFSLQQLKQRREHVAARFHSYQTLFENNRYWKFLTMERYVYSFTLKKSRCGAKFEKCNEVFKKADVICDQLFVRATYIAAINDPKRNGSKF